MEVKIEIDLPFPPSVNHIWQNVRGKVIRNAIYSQWIKMADTMVLLHRSYPKTKIDGRFEATILLNYESGGGDLDNRLKAVLDWAQSREIITDDKHCRRLIAAWVPSIRAPHGCLLVLRSLNGLE